jgi:hypothetical protein
MKKFALFALFFASSTAWAGYSKSHSSVSSEGKKRVSIIVAATTMTTSASMSGCNFQWAEVTFKGGGNSKSIRLGSGTSPSTTSLGGISWAVEGVSVIGHCNLANDPITDAEAFMFSF